PRGRSLRGPGSPPPPGRGSSAAPARGRSWARPGLWRPAPCRLAGGSPLQPPAPSVQPFEAPHEEVEPETDEADQDHARDHQVVAPAGVPRIDDQVAQPRV